MNGIARALKMDPSRGSMKVIVDAKTDQILGCTVFGIVGGEIMAMLQIAMPGRLPYTVLKEAIFSRQTLAEAGSPMNVVCTGIIDERLRRRGPTACGAS